MSTVETRGGKIVIKISGFESWKAVEMVFCPVPDVTKHIVKSHGISRVHVDRLWGVGSMCGGIHIYRLWGVGSVCGGIHVYRLWGVGSVCGGGTGNISDMA